MINRAIEGAISRHPERALSAVEKEVKGRYLVLDTKQRSLSLSQEGMALLFNLMLQEPDVVFRCVGEGGSESDAAGARCGVQVCVRGEGKGRGE